MESKQPIVMNPNLNIVSVAAERHIRAVYALLLRDIQTRVGGSYLGFLASLLFPLAHISILLLIYIIMGRRAPIGTDVILYLTSAILPFIIWSYTHQKIMFSFSQNKILTSFPIIKFMDILIARAIVEVINSSLIIIVVAISLVFLGVEIIIYSPSGVFVALAISYVFGISTGFLFGTLTLISPVASVIGFLIIPLYWITSGNFFIPDSMPESIRQILYLFPIAHIVDYLRMNLYPSYLSDFNNLDYVIVIIIGNILSGALIQKGFMNYIMGK